MSERCFVAVTRKTPYQSKTPLLSGSRIHERWTVARQFAEVDDVLLRDALLRRGDERDRAVWIAHIALDARRAAAVRAALERGVVVEHVPLALEEHAAAVDRAGSLVFCRGE